MAKATSGKEGSVAPKERINIVYRPETGNAQEEVELPMRFLVLGDFTGREDSTPLEERQAVSIDKESFDRVLDAYDVRADFNVPNELSEGEGAPQELGVALRFSSMRDFTPDAICEQMPELKQLIELRDALSAFKGPLGNIPAFRKRLEAILDDPAAQERLIAELGLEEGSG